MWVPKKPRRSDFCGCPPCPLCFVFVQPAPPKVVKQETPILECKPAPPEVVDGVVQMGREMLGRDPTAAELVALKKGAETIHEQNVLRKKDEDETQQRFKDADREKRLAMIAEQVIVSKQRERAAPKPRKALNTVTIDTMDKNKVREKTNSVAPVDQELLDREYSRALNRYPRV